MMLLAASLSILLIGFFLGYGVREAISLHHRAEACRRAPSVVSTPLPAALPLFATGLGALGLLGWRRKREGRSSRRLIKTPDRIPERPPRGGLSTFTLYDEPSQRLILEREKAALAVQAKLESEFQEYKAIKVAGTSETQLAAIDKIDAALVEVRTANTALCTAILVPLVQSQKVSLTPTVINATEGSEQTRSQWGALGLLGWRRKRKAQAAA